VTDGAQAGGEWQLLLSRSARSNGRSSSRLERLEARKSPEGIRKCFKGAERRSGACRREFERPPTGVRGSSRQVCRQPIKLRHLPPTIARKRRRGCRAIRSRSRAVKRAAVGGWMTARWSGVFHERPAETPRSQDPRAGGRRFYPRQSTRSPKVVLLRVLVSRTSVVETDSRHLDDARMSSREGRRAAASSDGEGCRPWTGSTAVHLAEGCPAMQRAKARCKPLGHAPSESAGT
jgi:hypothetical protein